MIGWEQFFDVWSMPAVQRALAALLIGSIGLPLVGVIIIGLNIVPVRFAMMHVALLGIAVGMVTGVSPLACALIACTVAGGALTPLARTPGGLSGATGLLMSLAMAAALLLIAVSGINAAQTFGLLWGSILGIDTADLVLVTALAAVVPLFLLWNRNRAPVLFADREFAQASGIRVDLLTGAMLVLTALAITAAMQLTGALLVDALTLLPALAARRLGRTLRSICAWAIGISLVSSLAGLSLAILFDLPPGPILVLVTGAFALVVNLIPKKGINPSWRSATRHESALPH